MKLWQFGGRRARLGFTIVEVLLFLAVSGALAAGLLAGTTSTINRQRYNDSVQDFTEFLRSTYSGAMFVENPRLNNLGSSQLCNIRNITNQSGHIDLSRVNTQAIDPRNEGNPGKTDCAIYGKLITFGELYDPHNPRQNREEAEEIYVYNVVGTDQDLHTSLRRAEGNVVIDTATALNTAKVEALTIDVRRQNGVDICQVAAVNGSHLYRPSWKTFIQSNIQNQNSREVLAGSLLILRSPIDNMLHTFWSDTPVRIQHLLRSPQYNQPSNCGSYTGISVNDPTLRAALINSDIKDPHTPNGRFTEQTVNLCLNSHNGLISGKRRHIRIEARGNNASAVVLTLNDMPAHMGGNAC